MTIEKYLSTLKNNPQTLIFSDLMSVIEDNYTYHPVSFDNGDVHNEAGENAGSCKLLAFAQLNGLNEAMTLACFGEYYREDVLKNPDGTDHQNIRNFMRHGWSGVKFSGMPLAQK